MKVMCSQCGKILDLMLSQSFVVEEDSHLKSYYFCSGEHMKQFAERKRLKLGKD